MLTAGILLGSIICIRYAKIIPPEVISKFPLNAAGVLYGSSLLYFVYSAALAVPGRFTAISGPVFSSIALFGRNSLLAFVIHVYAAKLIGIMSSGHQKISLDYALILFSIAAIYVILSFYESRGRNMIRSVNGYVTRMAGLSGRV
jgi:hypothetical protein